MWLLLAGRGYGKTRTGAEWVRGECESGRRGRIALIAPTAADARDIMVEGESGILACCPPWCKPVYQSSKRRVLWPNGALATLYSAEEPDRLNGPQHDGGWADEVGVWPGVEAWDMFMMGLRLGQQPQAVATTTPKRQYPVMMRLIKDLLKAATTVVTRGSTYENRANLAPSFFTQVVGKYEGTQLGRQELGAELLEDSEDALWKRPWLEEKRLTQIPEGVDLVRLIVGVDPSATATGAEAGIITAGVGSNGRGYVISDDSLQGSPAAWARAAVTAYHLTHADRIAAEVNNGGDMVEQTIRTVEGGERVGYKTLHASRGKHTRAEPVASLYERGLVHHVGTFPALEDELCTWVPGMESPNRLDALVWALTELMLGAGDLEPLDAELSTALAGFTGL